MTYNTKDSDSSILPSSITNKNQARLRLVINNESSGGYKSGRSSWRGMPVAVSTDKTRRGGTPERRHFCKAWYFTPSFSESGNNPPPALIARSTTSMSPTLQPKSVIRQQPSNVIGFVSMQLMVANAKKQQMKDFSERLKAKLKDKGGPTRGMPAWLSRELKDRTGLKFSTTTCQKWLGGLQIPRSSHLQVLVNAFGLNQQELTTGEWEPPPGSGDQRLLEIHKVWNLIPDEKGRQHVLDTALLLAGIKSKTEPQKKAR